MLPYLDYLIYRYQGISKGKALKQITGKSFALINETTYNLLTADEIVEKKEEKSPFSLRYELASLEEAMVVMQHHYPEQKDDFQEEQEHLHYLQQLLRYEEEGIRFLS